MRIIPILVTISALMIAPVAFGADDEDEGDMPKAAVDTATTPAAAVPATTPSAIPAAPPEKLSGGTITTDPATTYRPSVSTAPGEPDIKVAKDAGGKATSWLITSAPLRDDYVLGNRKAPLVIVEYASMSCPHCATFSNTTLPALQKKYIDSGKVAYVLRQFPLNEPALKAAELLDCVGQQKEEKYFTFAKVLFDAQSKWAFDTNYEQGLETIATVGGVTKEQYKACTSDTDREVKILKDKQTANETLAIPHTPYIFIGGEVYEGDRSIEPISQFIDGKLAGKH